MRVRIAHLAPEHHGINNSQATDVVLDFERDETMIGAETEQLYYIIDNRGTVGNCASFWAKEGKGYCCDIKDAGLFKLNHSDRETDIQVPREVVEWCIVQHVRLDTSRAGCSKQGVSFAGGRIRK